MPCNTLEPELTQTAKLSSDNIDYFLLCSWDLSLKTCMASIFWIFGSLLLSEST